jgi:hypothetical protein
VAVHRDSLEAAFPAAGNPVVVRPSTGNLAASAAGQTLGGEHQVEVQSRAVPSLALVADSPAELELAGIRLVVEASAADPVEVVLTGSAGTLVELPVVGL